MFQALLFSYYVCDAAAGVAMLDRTSVARCIGIYQAVKAHFLSEDERAALAADPLGFGGAIGSAAYLRFDAWEKRNATLVAELKADAEAELAATAPGY